MKIQIQMPNYPKKFWQLCIPIISWIMVIGLEHWTKIKHEKSPSPSSDQTNSLITNGFHHPLHFLSYFPKSYPFWHLSHNMFEMVI